PAAVRCRCSLAGRRSRPAPRDDAGSVVVVPDGVTDQAANRPCIGMDGPGQGVRMPTSRAAMSSCASDSHGRYGTAGTGGAGSHRRARPRDMRATGAWYRTESIVLVVVVVGEDQVVEVHFERSDVGAGAADAD